jgi:glycosyltransferase involved in cell wall biosynthesis
MQIAYDASILGAGYLNPKARTGIFRTVEALLQELLTLPDISLKAISLDQETTIWEEMGTAFYFQELYPQLAHSFCSVHHSRLHLRGVYGQLACWQKQLIEASTHQPVLYKVGRLLQILSERFFRFEVTTQFDSAAFDVYHSLYFPLPSRDLLGDTVRVLTIHDLIPILFPQFVIPAVQRRCRAILESIDRDRDWIICNSQHTKQDFCTYTQMNPDRVFVTPLAVANFLHPVTDTAVIASTLEQYGIPNAPYLLSLATLEPRKNLDFLIRCFAQLVGENPGLELNLVLVGVSGWKNAEVFQAVNQNPQVRSRIFFTGYLPDQALSAIYSGAIAFVYPSLYEGFGLPPLEAMQCGTPVITSNTSSLPEVVGDGGILVDPTKEDELCQALWQVITDTSLQEVLAARARQRASQFSWATCAKQTAEVYCIAAANRSL